MVRKFNVFSEYEKEYLQSIFDFSNSINSKTWIMKVSNDLDDDNSTQSLVIVFVERKDTVNGWKGEIRSIAFERDTLFKALIEGAAYWYEDLLCLL